MKKLLTLLLLFLCGVGFMPAAHAAETAPSPRILTLSGATHPKARVVSVDPATGTLAFAWLKADSTPADSGNSIARFTPPAPIPKANPSDPDTYAPVADATLVAAIQAAG